MNMPKTTLPSVALIGKEYPDITFEAADTFCWSPQKNTVFFDPIAVKNKRGLYQLLHEVGHAICGHVSYRSGVALIQMESEAWEAAKKISANYNIRIPEEHIEKCLDSYRDWLHLRSACPSCSSISIEVDENQYRCFNCSQAWRVPTSQLTRQYRMKLS
jgi:hypothetical protein